MSRHWWSTGSGRIELQITKRDADVRALPEVAYIADQLRALDPALVAAELREYGTWDDDELQDHAQNLQRLLWIATNDLSEELFLAGN